MILVAKIFIFSTNNKTDSDNNYRSAFRRNYKIFAIEIPEKISLAGEVVPLDKYYVRESIDRELISNTYYHSHTLLLFKRAYRWFPIIEPILKENNIPDDFKYLAMIESSLSNAVSPAGARGFWQFMKKTAGEYNLEVNNEVDERYNLEKATIAACKYLLNSYKIYNSWALAAAAYNAGNGGVSKQLEVQKSNNYYDLYLNTETSRYVYRILALKIIYTNPTKYGFYLREKDFYPPIPTYEVIVDSTISNLPDFALEHNINYRILKDFNPWLRRRTLTNKDKKIYKIKLPKKCYKNYQKLFPVRDFNKDVFFNDTIKINQIR